MNKSYLTAVIVSVVFILWMLSGILSNDESQTTDSDANDNSNIMLVVATPMEAKLATSYVIAQGSLIPNREVTLRAETAGQIESLLANEGSVVTADSNLMRIKMDDRIIRREQAQIKLLEQQRQYDAIEGLKDQGFVSTTNLDTALFELKKAEVELEIIKLEIEKVTIKSPFNGIIEEVFVDLGEFVGVGNELLTIVDNNPLIVNIFVSQQDVQFIDTSTMVEATLINGEKKKGTIRFISPRADVATRTYRVEIAIPNDEGLRAGSSATAHIPKEQTMAHYVSAALLTLNDKGEIGIKVVDAEGWVSFFPINIVSSDANGMWISGVPDQANIITTGQGFAPIGEQVRVSLLSGNNISLNIER